MRRLTLSQFFSAFLIVFVLPLGCKRGSDSSNDTSERANLPTASPAAMVTTDSIEQHNALFTEGAQLVIKYIRLSDNEPADPTTKTGRSELNSGIANLRAALKMKPDDWSALWFIGKAQEALGDRAAAYASLRAAYRINDSQPDVIREFVLMAMSQGKGDEAVAAAKRAVSLAPGDHGLKANLGLALLVRGDVDEALRVTQSALEAAPDDQVTKALLSLIRDVAAGKRPRPTRYPE